MKKILFYILSFLILLFFSSGIASADCVTASVWTADGSWNAYTTTIVPNDWSSARIIMTFSDDFIDVYQDSKLIYSEPNSGCNPKNHYANVNIPLVFQNGVPLNITTQANCPCGCDEANAAVLYEYTSCTSPLSVSCFASSDRIDINQTVTFASLVSGGLVQGGAGSYIYSWSGACVGSGASCSNNFPSQGKYTSAVEVTSGSQTQTVRCSADVTQQQQSQCPQSLAQTSDFIIQCTTASQLCVPVYTFPITVINSAPISITYNTRSTHCSSIKLHILVDGTERAVTGFLGWPGGSTPLSTVINLPTISAGSHTIGLQAEGLVSGCNSDRLDTWGGSASVTANPTQCCTTHASRKCSGNHIYWYNSCDSQQELIQNCSSNQTCQNAQCVTTTVNHDHQACYNNSVYWFDSNNSRNDIYEDCGDDVWTSNYRCSNSWLQRQKTDKGCSNAACFATNSWLGYQDCSLTSQTCQNNVCYSSPTNPALNVSCSANPSSIQIGQSSTFNASVSGGNSSYNYSWTGACSGSSSTCYNSFLNSGTQNAYLNVTSGGQTGSAACSVSVNQQQSNRYLSCYNNDLYWYDSQLGKQEFYQSCGNSSCINSGSNYCIGNSVYQQQTCYDRGCAGNACYNTGTSDNNPILVQTCGSNQTCQNGSCANNQLAYITHSYKWCYNSSVYWYDSNNARQDIYQTCGSNQTCQTSYCVNNSQPTPTQYKGCYNNGIYWFSSSTNVRLNFFQSCQDQNSCTLDSCANAKCSNPLKCDGTTCSNGSADYCSNCNHVGDGVCNCGENIDSNPQECGVIGLALTLFGKKENGSVQWSKTFGADANQVVDFLAVISNGQNTTMNDVTVKVDFPQEVIYQGSLTLEGNSFDGDIRTGVSLGSLDSKATKALTFKAKIADNSSISKNEADVIGTVTTSLGFSQDNLKISFNKTSSNQNEFKPEQGLAGLLHINFSNPLYILILIIVIIIAILVGARIFRPPGK